MRTLHDDNALFVYKEHNLELKNANAFEMAIHIHPNAELLIVSSGEITLTMSNRENEIIRGGEAALIFPFQPHGYSRAKDTEHYRISFSTFLAKIISYFPSQISEEIKICLFPPKSL